MDWEDRMNDKEIESLWTIFLDELKDNEHFKKEVAPGLTFMINTLEDDDIEYKKRN